LVATLFWIKALYISIDISEIAFNLEQWQGIMN